jgi:hypothetical protein
MARSYSSGFAAKIGERIGAAGTPGVVEVNLGRELLAPTGGFEGRNGRLKSKLLYSKGSWLPRSVTSAKKVKQKV